MTFLASIGRKRAGARLLAALAGAAAIGVAGCGGDDEEPEEASAEPQPVAIEVTEEGGEASYEVPESVEAGLAEITLTNSSESPHDAQLIRVEGEHSGEEVVEAIVGSFRGEPLPEWFFGGGGVGTTEPGATRSVTQALEPGTYYMVDTEPRGTPAEPPAIEVTGEAAEAELPEAPATITASEYTFEAEGLTADGGPITFENAGEQPHHVVAAPMTEGSTIEDVEEFARTEEGPPPVDFQRITSSAVLEGGTGQEVELELESGDYALLCFISDREGGPPHVAEGMITEATVE